MKHFFRTGSCLVVLALLLTLGGVALPAGAEEATLTEWETALTFGETVTIPAELNGEAVQSVRRLFSTPHPEVKKLVFAEGIRLIGVLTLDQLPSLTEVVLPRSLVAIAQGSFIGCASLTELTIPAGVLLIHEPEKTFDAHLLLRGESDCYIARYAAHHALNFEPIVYTASLGDVNADGLCNTTDARLLLQHATDKAVDAAFADVDGDGVVNTTDARLVLQYAVGKAIDCAISVPTNRPSQTLISSAATVEAEYLWVSGSIRKYGPIRDDGAAICAVNNIVAESYDATYRLYFCIIAERFHFTQPDGSVIIYRQQQCCAPELLYLGVTFYGMNAPKYSANWKMLHNAVD